MNFTEFPRGEAIVNTPHIDAPGLVDANKRSVSAKSDRGVLDGSRTEVRGHELGEVRNIIVLLPPLAENSLRDPFEFELLHAPMDAPSSARVYPP